MSSDLDALESPTPNAVPPPSGERTCRLCGAALLPTAIYCRECQNYQSGIRRLLSGLNISELTALVSTTALAATFLNTHLLVRSAEIAFTPLSCSDDGAKLLVINKGTRPASVQSAFLARLVDGSPEPKKVEMELKTSSGSATDPILSVEQGRSLSFSIKGIGFAAVPHNVSTCYTVELQTIEFDGKIQKGVKPCPCA